MTHCDMNFMYSKDSKSGLLRKSYKDIDINKKKELI